eukprot:gnl/MRDRNA2_/MRDRNA2_92223_c0_seq1.p1 gnl/MRDRNA2_/MRDRNA2_92223_c0~~gnl/MRDRNA2_/MRDRNA2_92223_c0_seq1.p1  ORF type:complete len:391 (-),score=74.67 gnl/MRDRNA2_/MRDRNA2_92223_c0_seq1:469-1641(-)
MPLGNAHLQLMRLAQQKKMAGDGSMTKPHSKARSPFGSGSQDSSISTTAPQSPASSEECMASQSATTGGECMTTKYEQLQEQFEQLQLDHEAKCNELVECEHDLKAARVEIQELQLLLKSQTGQQRSSVIPDKIATGSSGPGVVSTPQAEEIRRMFAWLAEQVELDDAIEFDASEHNLVVASQKVQLGRIVQWRLTEGDLRLTVPQELASEISHVLAAAKENPNTLRDASARTIMDSWLLSINEAPSDSTSAVTLLTHCQSHLSCIVANFPTPHPVHEFGGYRLGDTVEVCFEGEWFIGVVKLIKCHGEIFVQCDVDPPEVYTKGFLHSLRRPVATCAEPTSQMADIPISEAPQQQSQVSPAEVAHIQTMPQSSTQRRMAFSHTRTRTCP